MTEPDMQRACQGQALRIRGFEDEDDRRKRAPAGGHQRE
jgi:hypothetical protein